MMKKKIVIRTVSWPSAKAREAMKRLTVTAAVDTWLSRRAGSSPKRSSMPMSSGKWS